MDYINRLEKELDFSFYEDICLINSQKVYNAFHECNLSESDFMGSTGYGYGDIGRDKIEKIYSLIFKAEDALVRSQLISGTHALTVTLFGLLRPGDLLLSITGTPYDTLHEVIGIKDNLSSLKSYGISYDQIELRNDDFDDDQIINYLKSNKVKVIEIQRSKGYSMRKSLSIDKLERIIKKIRKVDSSVIIMVDNCYCEFVSSKEPIEIGADICVGSLIKNLGGTLCDNGAYIVGKKELIKLCSERLNVPGEAKEIGPSLNANRMFARGLAFAPSVVLSSLKISLLTSKIMEDNNIMVEPASNEIRSDIVTSIVFNNKELMIKYCQKIQSASLVDSGASLSSEILPGYDDPILMASGSFVQGSSIELSCDGPVKDPYVVYQQGGMTYEYGKIALANICKDLFEK